MCINCVWVLMLSLWANCFFRVPWTPELTHSHSHPFFFLTIMAALGLFHIVPCRPAEYDVGLNFLLICPPRLCIPIGIFDHSYSLQYDSWWMRGENWLLSIPKKWRRISRCGWRKLMFSVFYECEFVVCVCEWVRESVRASSVCSICSAVYNLLPLLLLLLLLFHYFIPRNSCVSAQWLLCTMVYASPVERDIQFVFTSWNGKYAVIRAFPVWIWTAYTLFRLMRFSMQPNDSHSVHMTSKICNNIEHLFGPALLRKSFIQSSR